MHATPMLGLSDARRALVAMLDAAEARPGRPVAVVIVDGHGDMVTFACMAGANPALARQNAFKKAYTAACMRTDTRAFAERILGSGRTLADFGTDALILDSGGLVITREANGPVLGGIGVSGRSSEEDEEIALAGRATLHLTPFERDR